MQLNMFIIPIKNVSEAEAEMSGFLRGHRILAGRRNSCRTGRTRSRLSAWSIWTVPVPGSGRRAPKVDYKEVLKPEEFEIFSRLRDWRKAEAGDVPLDP